MRLILIPLLAALGACSSIVPTVQYRAIGNSADMDGMTDAFFLQSSSIMVEKEIDPPAATSAPGPKAKDAPAVKEAKVSSVRGASAFKYGIKAISSWRADTVVNLTKVPNTDVIASAGIQTTDKTAKAIGDYGGAIVSIVGAIGVMFKLDDCTYPITLPITSTMDGRQKETITDNACISVDLAPVAPDAMERERIPLNTDTSYYYYSACRDATVHLLNARTDGPKVLRVADPRFVQRVQFPTKGSITAHSECGVSVTSEATSGDSGAAIVAALSTEAKAIKDALDSSKKASK